MYGIHEKQLLVRHDPQRANFLAGGVVVEISVAYVFAKRQVQYAEFAEQFTVG